jgi:hypothetical protein
MFWTLSCFCSLLRTNERDECYYSIQRLHAVLLTSPAAPYIGPYWPIVIMILIKPRAFVGSNCSNRITMHGMESVRDKSVNLTSIESVGTVKHVVLAEIRYLPPRVYYDFTAQAAMVVATCGWMCVHVSVDLHQRRHLHTSRVAADSIPVSVWSVHYVL